ncbi:MAG: hypothetical protein ACU836_02780 [Gammaproteobacteria bacterium]
MHAFGTAGLVYVPTGEADFVRDTAQLTGAKGGQWSMAIDSLIGGQVNLKFSDQFEVIGQAASRHRYDDTYIPELTWAFAKLTPRPDLELRGGRLGTDLYMRSDSRLVGYSYLTVRPSVDYYGGLPHQSFDGIDGTFTLPVAGGTLRSKLFGGFNHTRIPLENTAPWGTHGALIVGGSLDYTVGSWQMRLGYAQIDLQSDLPGEFSVLLQTLKSIPSPGAHGAADSLAVNGTTSRHYSAGVVYDEGPLQVQLMVSGVKHQSAFFQDSVSGYLLGGYRIGSVTPYAGFSWSTSSPAHLGSTGSILLDRAVAQTIARTHTNQHTFTLGMRWDFRSGMDIKAQWDAIEGSSDSIFLYRWEQPGWNGRMHVLSLTFDFAF